MSQILPLRHLFLKQRIVSAGLLLRKPGTIGWIPEVGGLVSGAPAFVQLRRGVGLGVGHVDMSPS